VVYGSGGLHGFWHQSMDGFHTRIAGSSRELFLISKLVPMLCLLPLVPAAKRKQERLR